MKKIFLSAPRFISFLILFLANVPKTNAQTPDPVNCTPSENFKPYANYAPPSKWKAHVSAATKFSESTAGGRTGVLEIKTSNTNSKTPYTDPGHGENLQGGIYELNNSNVVVLKADVYISTDFLTEHRRTDMWGIAKGDFEVFGELAFRNVDGKHPDFYYWDGNNNFHNANIKITAGTWYTLEMRVSEFNIDYYINGKKVGELHTNTFINRFIQLAFHNYNFNDPALPKEQYNPNAANNAYSAYWDNPQALCGTSCGPNMVKLYHDCMPECVKNSDVQNKLKDKNHWSQTPCPPSNNTTVKQGSMRSNEGAEPRIAEEVSTKLNVSNYPNPFAGRTTIQYQLPEAGKVTLRVFDILGRPVTTLVDGPKTQGTYKVEFNASKLSKGNYFYKIIVNTNSNKILTQTGNMNLINQ